MPQLLQRYRGGNYCDTGGMATDSVYFTADSLNWLQKSANGYGVTLLIAWITYDDQFGDHHKSYLCERLNGRIGPHTVVDCGGEAPEDY